MARRNLNGRNAYDKAVLLRSNLLSLSTKVLMQTRRGGLRAGYLNKLARQEKKVRAQMRSESSGPRTKDWLLGY